MNIAATRENEQQSPFATMNRIGLRYYESNRHAPTMKSIDQRRRSSYRRSAPAQSDR